MNKSMDRPYYQEKFKIGRQEFGAGFNPASRMAGDGDSNLKFIYSETGAIVTIRGRGSGFIEPRMGRESNDPLHALVEHESSYEAFQRACELVQDLIDTVNEDWSKLQTKHSNSQGPGDFYWRDEKSEDKRQVSQRKRNDDERSNLRVEEKFDRRGDRRGEGERNFKGYYDDPRETENRGGRESDRRGEAWSSSRDDRNPSTGDWSFGQSYGRDYQDEQLGETSWGTRDQHERDRWSNSGERDREGRWGSTDQDNKNSSSSSRGQFGDRWGDKNRPAVDVWARRSNQQDETRWDDGRTQEGKQNLRNQKGDGRSEQIWDGRFQETKQSWSDKREDSRADQIWDREPCGMKQSGGNKMEDLRTERTWDSGSRGMNQSWTNQKEEDRSQQRWRYDDEEEKKINKNQMERGKMEQRWGDGLQEPKQNLGNREDVGRTEYPWGVGRFQDEKQSRIVQKGSDRIEHQRDRDDKIWPQREKQKKQQDTENKKRSRWDTSSQANKETAAAPKKNVLGVVLDQKRKIEEKLDTIKKSGMSLKDTNSLARSSTNSLNPLNLDQYQLQSLNHEQLLKVSQQQQALLMQLSANLKQPLPVVNPFSSNNLTNFQVNPLMSLTPNPLFNFQPLQPAPSVMSGVAFPVGAPTPNKPFHSEYLSKQSREENSQKQRVERFDENRFPRDGNVKNQQTWSQPSTSWRQSPPIDKWEEKGNLMHDESNKRRQSPDRRRQSMVQKNPPTGRYSPSRGNVSTFRKSPPRRNVSPFRKSPLRRNSPLRSSSLQRNSSQFERKPTFQKSPPHNFSTARGSERYSPQLNDGQERYSPQLEDDVKSPTQYSGRDDFVRNRGEEKIDDEKKRKKLLRFRVAVIDRKFNKLTPQDEMEIRSLVYKELNSLSPSNMHNIDFLGFGSQDYIFVLLPHTLEAMKWLLNMVYLDSMRRSYTLFPYEDIHNRFRMRTTLFFDMLEGYKPTPNEVILELGRINEGLCTEMWKTLKFIEEKEGFFLMLNVDFLSYLQLRKMMWKPRYRMSFIRIEPLKNERGIEERFNRK